jgi:hypothetical protein
MLAGDLFDTPNVLRRLTLFRIIYAFCSLRELRSWWAEHRYRLGQARVRFTGGTTSVDSE